jgi:hypothetical protein
MVKRVPGVAKSAAAARSSIERIPGSTGNIRESRPESALWPSKPQPISMPCERIPVASQTGILALLIGNYCRRTGNYLRRDGNCPATPNSPDFSARPDPAPPRPHPVALAGLPTIRPPPQQRPLSQLAEAPFLYGESGYFTVAMPCLGNDSVLRGPLGRACPGHPRLPLPCRSRAPRRGCPDQVRSSPGKACF